MKTSYKFLIVSVAFLIASLSLNSITRYAWRTWIGNEITWKNIKFNVNDLNNDLFVAFYLDSPLLPISDDRPIIIGKHNSSETPFTFDSYLLVNTTSFDVDRLPILLVNECQKISCSDYKEQTFKEKNLQVRCIQFKGTSDILDNKQFHEFCNVYSINILVEYHGSTNDFNSFNSVKWNFIKAILNYK